MMKASVLHGIDDLRYEDVEIPTIGNDDVLVKVKACGICGSDVPRVLKTGTYHFPTIPGHEFGGQIVKIGKNVDSKWLNRNVAVIPLIPCHECNQCEIGNFQLCANYDYLGSRNDGGFAEYCRVPKDNLVLVPDGVDFECAAMLEPITVAQHVASNIGIDYGDDVALSGLGAIGLFIAQWAKAMGANHVFAIDLDSKKVAIAKKIGLTDAICSKEVDPKKIIFEKTNKQGVDSVFEASGSEFVFNEAISLLKHNGKLGLVGRPIKPLQIQVDTFEKILRRQITIKGTWAFEMKNTPHNAWDISLEALRDGKIVAKPIISSRLPLSKVYDGIRIMADHTEFFYKILVEPELDE